MDPFWPLPIKSTIVPLLSIIAENPSFVALTNHLLFSKALILEISKCWYGPKDLPNQESLLIFTIKLELLTAFLTSLAKTMS